MKLRSVLLVSLGFIFFLAGCAPDALIFKLGFDTSMKFLRTTLLASDRPITNPKVLSIFETPSSLRGINDTYVVVATVHNPTDRPLEYEVSIATGDCFADFETTGLVIGGDPTCSTITLPPGQSAQLHWKVTTTETGQRYLRVSARSIEDMNDPIDGRWPNWKNSDYQEWAFDILDVFGLPGEVIVLMKRVINLTCFIIGAMIIRKGVLYWRAARRARTASTEHRVKPVPGKIW
jgi:hypothetical protein